MILDYIADRISRIAEVDFKKVRQLTDFSKVAHVESKIAFLLAKERKSNPQTIAEDIVARLTDKFIEKVEATAGYINIWLSAEFFDFYLKNGLCFFPKKQKVIVEYPSVNPNKPWHIGHLRNAVLGEATAGLLELLGYEVIRMNYINDLGLQIAQSFWYHKKFGKPCREKFDHCIGKEYVEAARLFEKYEQEIRALLRQMEQGLAEAREFVERVVEAQHQTAKNYNIKSDVYVFESDIVRELLKEGLELLKKSGIITAIHEGEKAGCWTYKDKVLIRSDGTLTYTGKDVIFQMWKLGKLKPLKYQRFLDGVKTARSGIKMDFSAEWLINVIGMEQQEPQKLIKEILNILNVKGRYDHLAYQSVRLQETRFSGRKGTWIGYTADELLAETEKRLAELRRLDEETLRKLSVAAVKIYLLKFNLKKEIIFDWQQALNFEGDSGVYLMYSLVRAKSVLKRAGTLYLEFEKPVFNEEEIILLLELVKLEEELAAFKNNLDVSRIINRMLKAAAYFNTFYAKHKILGSSEEKKRLAIVKKFYDVISLICKKIGIENVEKM